MTKQPERGQEPIYSFYVLKAICAFLVVACHVPNWFASSPITELAVPTFFMITGYFLYNEKEKGIPSISRAKKTIKHIFLLLLSLTLVYYIVQPTPWGYHGLLILIRWIFVSIPNRYGGPLWYLTAMFWGLIFFNLYIRQTKGRYVWALIPLTLIGLVIGKYRFLFTAESSSYFVFNFVNYALPCFAIGYLIHKHEQRLTGWKHLPDVALVILCLFSLEIFLLRTYSQGLSAYGPSLFVYPMCATVLLIACKYKHIGKNSIVATIGRDYSGHIYYWHMIFVAILANLFGTPNGTEMELPSYPYWLVVVFLLTLLFSWLVASIQKKLGLSFFK